MGAPESAKPQQRPQRSLYREPSKQVSIRALLGDDRQGMHLHIGMWYHDPMMPPAKNVLSIREEDVVPTIKAFLEAANGDVDLAMKKLEERMRQMLRSM